MMDLAGMRIALVIPTLRAGGSERVLTHLAGVLARAGMTVTVVCFQPPDEAPFFELADNVRLLRLAAISADGHLRWLKAVPRLRSVFRANRFEAVVGFTTVGAVLSAAAAAGLAVPLILSERADPAAHGARIGQARRLLRDWAYRQAARLVVQTAAAANDLGWLAPGRTVVLPNPVALPLGEAAPAVPAQTVCGPRFRLIAAGRFVADKGFDRLLPAFAHAAGQHLDWDLWLFGHGPLEAALQRQVADLGMAGRVVMPGTVSDLSAELIKAHLFVLPSRMEGFANVLAEAAAAGLPAVSYAGVGGTAELMVPGITGLLADPVEPVPALSQALSRLMGDPAVRAAMGTAARQHVRQFSPDRHDQAWLNVLAAAVTQHRGQSSVADGRIAGPAAERGPACVG